jgi:uncharacterized protein (DUF924 family)
MSRIDHILGFWFGVDGAAPRFDTWFKVDPVFDRACIEGFERDHEAAAAGHLDAWQSSPAGSLALVVCLDQFPRNMYRGTSRAYSTDAQARATAERAIALGHDRVLPPVRRLFLYLPFEHSEDMADQRRSVALFRSLAGEPWGPDAMRSAERHAEIVERFGRFPHRNAALGRTTTPEEARFLTEPNSSF